MLHLGWDARKRRVADVEQADVFESRKGGWELFQHAIVLQLQNLEARESGNWRGLAPPAQARPRLGLRIDLGASARTNSDTVRAGDKDWRRLLPSSSFCSLAHLPSSAGRSVSTLSVRLSSCPGRTDRAPSAETRVSASGALALAPFIARTSRTHPQGRKELDFFIQELDAVGLSVEHLELRQPQHALGQDLPPPPHTPRDGQRMGRVSLPQYAVARGAAPGDRGAIPCLHLEVVVGNHQLGQGPQLAHHFGQLPESPVPRYSWSTMAGQ